MRSQALDQPNFEHEEEVQNAKILLIRTRTNNAFKALSLFLLLTLAIALYRYLLTKDIAADGRIYQKIQQISYFDLSQELFSTSKLDQGSLTVTQEQLSKFAWTVLHMSSGTFPLSFDLNLASKFNTFLILFGELYPCKPCGRLFLKYLEEMRPFEGTTRLEIMIYLCKLHNKISQDIGKVAHDCSKVEEEWSLYTNSE